MHKDQPSKAAIPIYLSYLVRLWRAESDCSWLASVEAAGTHERHSFADLASLFAFLQAQTGTQEELPWPAEYPGSHSGSRDQRS
jgi:hypothetical protein